MHCLATARHILSVVSFHARGRSAFVGVLTHVFGLRHVRDDAVGDDEQDEVLAAVSVLGREVGHVLDHRREVGGSEQVDLGQASLVRLHNS